MSFLSEYADKILLICSSVKIFLVFSFTKSLDASMNKMSLLVLFFLRIIMQVGIPVLKNNPAGRPMTAYMLPSSTKCFLMTPSAPP